jgi:hypothetical protein
MSDTKLVTVLVEMEERFYEEIAGWALNLVPPANVELVLNTAAIMLAVDEPTRQRIGHAWSQTGLG